MNNPFDDERGSFYALVNAVGQYSLWPAFAGVPEGWRVCHGEDSRRACLEFIERTWTDPGPAGEANEVSAS